MPKVFVGNLSYGTTWEVLKDHFAPAGNVVSAIVLTSGSRSKGCGLVEYNDQAECNRAISTLDNTLLDGRMIQVREDREPGGGLGGGNRAAAPANDGGDRPKPSRGPKAKPPRSFETEIRPPSTRLFVSNLSWQTSKQNLHLAFGKVPGLKSAEIENTWNGRHKGSGIVEYETVEQAAAAIESLNKTELDERTIYVQFDKFQAGDN